MGRLLLFMEKDPSDKDTQRTTHPSTPLHTDPSPMTSTSHTDSSERLVTEDAEFLNFFYDILDTAILSWESTLWTSEEDPDADYWNLPVPIVEKRTMILGTSRNKTEVYEGTFELSRSQIISGLVTDRNELVYGTMFCDAYRFVNGSSAYLYLGTDRKVYSLDRLSYPLPTFTLWNGVNVLQVSGG
jgi:hypothetical protein